MFAVPTRAIPCAFAFSTAIPTALCSTSIPFDWWPSTFADSFVSRPTSIIPAAPDFATAPPAISETPAP